MGGKLEIRGITISLEKQAALCGGVGTSGPYMLGGELHFDDVGIATPAANSLHFVNGCVGSIRRSTFEAASGGILVNRLSGTTTTRVEIDRVLFQGSASSIRTGTGAAATITNSVLETVDVIFDSGASGAVAFSTIYGGRVFADGVRIENSILVAPGQTNSLLCTGCTSRSNIAFPQMATIAGTTNVDPQLENPANGDFRLKVMSPALNTAMPQPDLTTDHDFAGVARPQGAAHDIGAFERLP